jgi:hypothetical protein
LPSSSLTPEDWEIFGRLTSTELTDEERKAAVTPARIDPEEGTLFAPHFHPEWVPMELVQARLAAAFPAARERFVVPTQHNVIAAAGQWSGVEADVWSRKCGMKLQLLVHLKAERLAKASAFSAMIERTFRYRELQLLDILELAVRPDAETEAELARAGFADADLELAAAGCARLKAMIDGSGIAAGPGAAMLKNRLATDYMEIRERGKDPVSLDRLLSLVNLLKARVKARPDPERFCGADELIEEARSLGAGIVIPHPPRFWPALLAELDADGWEVWNPSTPSHAAFLTECLARRGRIKRPLLAFMGDDTHMSSKIRSHMVNYRDGADREIGFQPAWKDPETAAALRAAGQSRRRTMEEYMERLA